MGEGAGRQRGPASAVHHSVLHRVRDDNEAEPAVMQARLPGDFRVGLRWTPAFAGVTADDGKGPLS
jgi:hypothetical protein